MTPYLLLPSSGSKLLKYYSSCTTQTLKIRGSKFPQNTCNNLSVDTVSQVEATWNVMAHAQKPDFVFRWNGWVHLNRRGRHFSRLLAAVVMLDTPHSEVVWRVLATHSTHQFPLHFPSHASPCAITFQLDSTSAVLVLVSQMQSITLQKTQNPEWQPWEPDISHISINVTVTPGQREPVKHKIQPDPISILWNLRGTVLLTHKLSCQNLDL
jgi:hypothetical protein